MLAIAVGWLSQQLHDYYGRLVRAERLAAVGEVAVTLRHELNNALQAIAAEGAMLQGAASLGTHEREGVDTILHMTRRIQADVQKLATMTDAATTSYLGDTKMLKL
jgi:phosphoglycerate-specific signal transduction histidine kinase